MDDKILAQWALDMVDIVDEAVVVQYGKAKPDKAGSSRFSPIFLHTEMYLSDIVTNP